MSGGRPTVPADEALAYLDRMIERHPGHTAGHHCRLAGVPSSIIVRVRRSGRLEPATAERIMAVRDDHLARFPPVLAPVDRARAHVLALMKASGEPANAIARASGVSCQAILNLLNERTPGGGLTRPVYLALMRLRAEDIQSAWVERWPTVVRIRALQANGWSVEHLNTEWGMNVGNLARARLDSPMLRETEEAVRVRYEAIGDRPGGSAKSAGHARRLGFYPPIFYDEEMRFIEVEEETPEQRAQHDARLNLCILALTIADLPTMEVAQVLGTDKRHVNDARYSAGYVVRGKVPHWTVTRPYPGADADVRRAVDGVHIWSTIEALDQPGIDYVARLAMIASPEKRKAAA